VVLAVPRGPSQTEKDIWTADDDGDNAIRLTRSKAEEFSPVWSPDGSRIAYRVETADTPPDIWVMNADGSGNRNLTRTPRYTEWGPTWTPDGRRIVYSYDDNDDTRGGLGMNLWIMNADGSNKQPFHRDPWRSDEYAEFSPDGRSVVLISFSTTFAIFRLDANGHNKRRITPLAHNNSFPRWSPDGSMIAFHSDRDGNQEAYVMRRDGSRAPQRI
jgi:Tol biopolymer transport system component